MGDQAIVSVNPEAAIPRAIARTIAWRSAAASVAIGGLVLIGWVLDLDLLKTGMSGSGTTMKMNAALAFVAAGIALWLLEGPGVPARRAAIGLGAVVFAIGGLTLLEHALEVDLRIDQLLARDAPGRPPGRMALQTALSFLLAGASLLSLAEGGRRRAIRAQWLALPIAVIAFTSLLGFLYGIPILSGLHAPSLMAYHTAIGLLALAIGIVAVASDFGPASSLRSGSLGGRVLRRLLPPVIGLPIVLGALISIGYGLGFYSAGVSSAILVVSSSLSLAAVVAISSSAFDHLDAARAHSDAALVEANRELERRIEQKTAELRNSESRLRAVVETAREAIVTMDTAGVVTEFNPAAEDLFGFSRNEIVGRTAKPLIPDRFHTAHDGDLERFLTTGESRLVGRTVELVVRTKGGKELPVEVSFAQWSAGDQVFFTGIFRDLTIKKAAEEMRHDLIRMLSHDLKNPIAGVLGFAEFLRAELGGGGVLGEALDAIETSARSAIALTNNFLDADRVEQGHLELRLQSTSLNEIVEHVARHQACGARLHEVDLVTRLDATLPALPIDIALVDRSVANLVSNAIKFAPKGSVVEVATRVRGGRIVVSVRDGGPGVPLEERSKLFQRYGQTKQSKADSTGLGLFVAKTVLEAHGGSVRAEFPPGGGSMFELEFPLPEMPATTACAPR